MRSDLKKKLDSFTFETAKNHLNRNFLRNRRLRVKARKLKYKGAQFIQEMYLSSDHKKFKKSKKMFQNLTPVRLIVRHIKFCLIKIDEF